jgi:hypothetical protein
MRDSISLLFRLTSFVRFPPLKTDGPPDRTFLAMDRLVALLEEVNRSDIKPRDYLEENHHSAVPLIRSLLCFLLITEKGNLDWDAKDELEGHGFIVYPVEQDRFGWLIGAVLTNKGAIKFD